MEDRFDRYMAIARALELEYAKALGLENCTAVDFEGSCPFIACLEREPHTHYACPACGAMKFGNIFCTTCRDYREELGRRVDKASREGEP